MTANERLDDALALIDDWGAPHAAAAVAGPSGRLARHGDVGHRFRWASVTKLVTAWTVLIAAGRNLVALDEPAGPPGATVRHLLSHTSGLPFEGETILARPGTRRIYSNPGFDRLGALIAERTGQPFEGVVTEWVLRPLGMTNAKLTGRPSAGLEGSIDDLVLFASELLRPTLLPASVVQEATAPVFPGLPGVLPGVGNYDDCAWGLGFEVRAAKDPHWTGGRNGPRTFGHFGGAGTFLWVDPDRQAALAVLTDREFGPWALAAWPALSDAVLSALGR